MPPKRKCGNHLLGHKPTLFKKDGAPYHERRYGGSATDWYQSRLHRANICPHPLDQFVIVTIFGDR